MATFIVLCTFERAGLDQLLDETATTERAARAMAAVGGDLTNVWMCAGMYDLVAVVEAPSLQKALAFLVAFSSRGQMRTLTLAAESDLTGIVRDAKDVAAEIDMGTAIDGG